MSYFVDTHTHLFSEEFAEDRTAAVQRAIAAGVEKMLLPNIDLVTIEPMYALEREFPDHCFAMMGLHPEAVDANYKEKLEAIYAELKRRKFVGVGEIGIDLYWDKTYRTEQMEAFRQQVLWAKEFGIPFATHVRDSFPEVFAVLDEVWDDEQKGEIHCFTGGMEEVEKVKSYKNLYFGIGGVLTFKKSTLKEVIPAIPLDRIILETDSPYLAPVPMRGKRNESSFIPHIAEFLCTILEMPLDEIRAITTENAKRLYGEF